MMTEVISSTNRWSAFAVSPGGRLVAIVTRTTDLNAGKNDFRIEVYDVAELLIYVNSESSNERPLPARRTVAKFSTDSNLSAVQNLRWIDDSHLAFIAETSDQPAGQVYRLDAESQQLDRLTDHPEPIVSFDLSAKGDVLYNARAPVPPLETVDHFVVGERNLLEKMELQFQVRSKQEQRTGIETFFLPEDSNGPPRRLGPAFSYGLYQIQDVWISPDGTRAVGARMYPRFPGDWMRDYLPFAENTYLEQYLAGFEGNETDIVTWMWHLVVFDLERGTAMPLLDAPIGFDIAGYAMGLEWMGGSDRAIIGTSFMPLGTTVSEERDLRRRSPAVVEYDFRANTVNRVLEFEVPTGEQKSAVSFAGLGVLGDRYVVVERLGGASSRNGPLIADKVLEKTSDRWVEVTDPEVLSRLRSHRAHRRLTFRLHEGLNTPPDIVARDTLSDKEAVISDLNPQFKSLTFGKVKAVHWTDSAGTVWKGGLVFPPNFAEGRRYPMVIQTHGFNEHEFLIEGPFKGAYAAQALANKDIVVLQLENKNFANSSSEEREVYRRGLEAAIDHFDGIGLVDRSKIGIVGYSRTGHIIYHSITYSDYEFAAAIIADAFNISFMGYAVLSGVNGGMEEIENLMDGAVPWGERLDDWVEQSPSLHTDRVKTPILFEQYTLLINWWDIYALLKRQQKPVEWLVLLESAHEPERPMHRLILQQSSVDWFNFWLKGEEDPDPAKADQYVRWRTFREQQNVSKREADRSRASKSLRQD